MLSIHHAITLTTVRLAAQWWQCVLVIRQSLRIFRHYKSANLTCNSQNAALAAQVCINRTGQTETDHQGIYKTE